jgi:hypothetical protein
MAESGRVAHSHVARGLSEPKLGWYVPSFGRLVPTAQLLLDGDLDPAQPLDVDFTLLAPGLKRGDR